MMKVSSIVDDPRPSSVIRLVHVKMTASDRDGQMINRALRNDELSGHKFIEPIILNRLSLY